MSKRKKKGTGFFKSIVDVFLIFATGGLWIIWMLVRSHNRKRA